MASVKRPAFSSLSVTSKAVNSAATVSASFQLLALASSTAMRPRPSTATFLTPTPLRSRPFLKSSAARSVWLATCLSVSTPSTRWMPPCRSRPRLIAFFGGYRYHRDPRRTTRTTAARVLRFLGILVALHLHDARDGTPLELDLDLIGHAQRDRLVGHVRDRSEHPARRHHPIPALDGREHAVAFLSLLLLGPDHQEVEDREHRAE